MAVRQKRKRPIAIDLFCGAGGMSLGFEQAGFDVVLGVDYDGYHAAAHERNFPYGKTLCRSVAAISKCDIVAALDGERDIDLIVGGPPCQGFSAMGLRDVLDPRNGLIGHYVRIVREVRPRAFVMENVPGLLAGTTKPILDEAIAILESSGYAITHPVRVLDASEFGVPQPRRRLFVLGLRKDIKAKLEYPGELFDSAHRRPSVLKAIEDLPDVDRFDELYEKNEIRYTKSPTSDYAKIMRGRLSAPGDFSYTRNWNERLCTGCIRVRHTEKAIQLYSETKPGEMVPGHKLPRLDPDGIAPTLRAGSDSSHGAYTAPRPIHPLKPRCITVREAARLHGFPDWFGFYPLKWHAYRQIGNAVCPPVARVIGEQVIEAIGYKPTRPRKKVTLGVDYHLPAERIRGSKRIPQVVHYPPVIEWLFRKRFDESGRAISNPGFTFGDVKAAIKSTGVELSWVRADTFLSEIARSRNVQRLLEPCLNCGFTIRRREDCGYIGEFVTAGAEDGLEFKSQKPTNSISRNNGVHRGQRAFF